MESKYWKPTYDSLVTDPVRWARLIAKIDSYADKEEFKKYKEEYSAPLLVAEIGKNKISVKFKDVKSGIFNITIQLSGPQENPCVALLDSLDFLGPRASLNKKNIAVTVNGDLHKGYLDANEQQRKEAIQALEVAAAAFLFGQDKNEFIFSKEDEDTSVRVYKKEFLDELFSHKSSEENVRKFYQAQIQLLESRRDSLDVVTSDTQLKAQQERLKLRRRLIAGGVIFGLVFVAVAAVVLLTVFFPPAGLAVAGIVASAVIIAKANAIWLAIYGFLGVTSVLGVIKRLNKKYKETDTYELELVCDLGKEIMKSKKNLEEETKQAEELIKLLNKHNEKIKIEKAEFGLVMQSLGAKILSKYLVSGELKNCKEIDLRDAGIGSNGARSMAEALTVQTETSQIKLEKIDLTRNDIGVEVAKDIIKALEKNVTITELRIDDKFTARNSKGELFPGQKEYLSDKDKKSLNGQLMINRYLRGESFADLKKVKAYQKLFRQEEDLKKAALDKLLSDSAIKYIPYEFAKSLHDEANKILGQYRASLELSEEKVELASEIAKLKFLCEKKLNSKDICARNRLYDFISSSKETIGSSKKQAEDFIKECEKLEKDRCFEVFEQLKKNGVTPKYILNIIKQDVGKLVLGNAPFHHNAELDCAGLKQLQKVNKEAFIALLVFGFSDSETAADAKEKAELISALLKDPLLLSVGGSVGAKQKLENLIYHSMVISSGEKPEIKNLAELKSKLQGVEGLSEDIMEKIRDGVSGEEERVVLR